MNDYNLWIENCKEKEILKKYTQEEIKIAFEKKLTFGTGGVRAKLGLGSSLLNVYTIEKIASGFIKYLIENNSTNGVFIGYDSRYMSKEFALITAKLLEQNNIIYYILDDIIPTPVVSFFTRYYSCDAGVMITASHNPSCYNGYKIYDSTGAQVNVKTATNIQSFIKKQSFNFNFESDFTVKYLQYNLTELYLFDIMSLGKKNKKQLTVLFSPTNATTYKLLPKALNDLGYNLSYVTSQMNPDPNFDNALSINPEDKKAYIKALEVQNKEDIILLTDPDGDRIGIMIYHNKKYLHLSGNQVGSLLIFFILSNTSINKINNPVIYNTIVTGEMGAKIANSYNVNVKSTLTGFKYIGEMIQNSNDTFIFGYEESYGYLLKDSVRDKDSLQAAIVICEMANHYKKKNKTLIDVYDSLSKKYGYYIEETISYSLDDIQKCDILINEFKKIKDISGCKVDKEIDYLNDDTGLEKEKVVKKFFNDNWIVIRPSGTEPKIKFYVCIKSNDQKKNQLIYINIKNMINKLIDKL